MLELLWLIPTLPFLSFAFLALFGAGMARRIVAVIGVGSVGISALLTLLVGAAFLHAPPAANFYGQTLWTWMHIGNFAPAIGLRLDALSLVMIFVVTFVGFLIHLYSAEFMEDDPGYSRFFAYMNFFVGSMLTLVLADNLLLLYLGWEGVGLCSYLLIGFWYKDPVNGRAARKAFIVTRVGDTAMAIGLFLLLKTFGTLQIADVMRLATQQWTAGSGIAIAVAALLLGGALGKSAQLPLQVWLPDAMAGPSPVSALIHAATMVTAGVYLIARTNALFLLAPPVQTAVAVIGAVTLLVAGCSALTQRDIKRVLAYSTISQIGYMFLALGVGAWTAAIFHFMTHAFFKALLFLSAGVVILAMHEEHDMFKMGGLRKRMPLTFWTFLAGACSLSALPFVTAGFYSKDIILSETWASPRGGAILWGAGLVGALLTALYTFRMVFVTFFGPLQKKVVRQPRLCMGLPLVVLAVLSLVGGFVEFPRLMGNWHIFGNLMRSALPQMEGGREAGAGSSEMLVALATQAAVLIGIVAAWYLYLRRPGIVKSVAANPMANAVRAWWFADWGFDWFYDKLFVRPFVWIARINRSDFIDLIYVAIAALNRAFNRALSATQTGQVRWYATCIAGGAIILIAIAVFL